MTSIDAIASALEPLIPEVSRVSSPDGAVTLMLCDIADAGEAQRRLGPERWETLLRDHHVLVEKLLGHHDGQVVKYERDGFLASFASAHAALRTAIELQRAFAAQEGRASSGLELRLGLHSGFVIENAGGPLGRNVVLAARIAGYARPGEILVSSAVKRYTETDPTFSFAARGEHHFKGLHGEHTVFAVPWR